MSVPELEWIDMVMGRLHSLELDNTRLHARCSRLEELLAERDRPPTFAKFTKEDVYFEVYIPKTASPSIGSIADALNKLYSLKSKQDVSSDDEGSTVTSDSMKEARDACLFYHISLALNEYVCKAGSFSELHLHRHTRLCCVGSQKGVSPATAFDYVVYFERKVSTD